MTTHNTLFGHNKLRLPKYSFAVMFDYHIFHSVNRWLPPTQGWIRDQTVLFPIEKQTILAEKVMDKHPNVPVFFQKPKGINKWLAPSFKNRIRSHSGTCKTILFSHFGNRGWHDLNLPCDRRITRFYGYDLHRLPFENPEWKDRYLALFEKSDVVIAEGPFMKNELVKMACPQEKVVVLPFGYINYHEPKIRSINGFVKVFVAGAFKEKKGIDTALLACIEFIKNNPEIKIEINLVGDVINATNQDLLFNKQLDSLINDKIVSPHIKKHGFVNRNRLREIALDCHFALLPSQWAADRDCEGGFPVTFLEVMSTGLPIISTYHCDIPFAVNAQNGILCQERDYKALARAMEKMIDPETLASKSKAAQKTVEESFNWKKLKPLYHKAILNE